MKKKLIEQFNSGISLSGCHIENINTPADAIREAYTYLKKGFINSVEVSMTGHPPSKKQCIGPWDYTDDIINETNKALSLFPHKGAHIPFAFINLASLNPGIRKESFRQMELSLEIASKLSLEYVVTHPRFGTLNIVSREEEWEMWLESYSKLTDKAQSYGVILTIENGDRLSFEECADMVRTINSPFFAMTFDTGHANLEGNKDGKFKKYKTLAEFAENESDVIKNIHMHDNHIAKGDEHLAPGMGEIDFKSIINALLEHKNDNMIITLEFNWKYLDAFFNSKTYVP